MAKPLKLFLLISIAYTFFIFEYVIYIQNSIYTSLILLPEILPRDQVSIILFGYLLSILPIFWIRFDGKISSIIYVFIYVTVIVPSIIFTITNSNLEFNTRILFCFVILISFLLTHVVSRLPPIQLRLAGNSKKAMWVALLLATVGACGYFFVYDRSAFTNVDLIDVYGKRLEIRDAIQTGSRSRLNSYMANWLGTAIAPFLGVVGYRKKNIALIALALATAYISFAVSSQKTAFFSLIIALSFAVIALYLRRKSRRPVDISLIVAFVLIFGYAIMPFVVDWLWFQESILTFKVAFRLFHNNGYLTSVYLEFFKDQPLLLYADSFLSGLVDSPFSQSYSRMVGDYISNYDAQNNANANYLADGYVNAGIGGILFSSLQLGLVIWLFDSLSRGKDKILAAAALIPICIVFSNISIHTGLLSNGGFVSMFLLLLLPDETPSRWTEIRSHRKAEQGNGAGPSSMQTERPG